MSTIRSALAPLARVLPLYPDEAIAEDGYELWLRYRPLAGAARTRVISRAKSIVLPRKPSLTILAAVAELDRAIEAMTGRSPTLGRSPATGSLVLATPASMPRLGTLGLELDALGAEGYVVRAMGLQGRAVTLIAANTDVGVLYGTFAWLRAVKLGRDPAKLDERSVPRIRLRMLNHWDNLDRTIERGYAGVSIWDWWKLPEVKDTRYVDYARACASLGINGVSVNNVSSQAEMLMPQFIAKAVTLADVFRPYGIKLHFAIRWSSPIELDGLPTADPLDPKVRAWWKAKADEIYRVIPDFGGWIIKANS